MLQLLFILAFLQCCKEEVTENVPQGKYHGRQHNFTERSPSSLIWDNFKQKNKV